MTQASDEPRQEPGEASEPQTEPTPLRWADDAPSAPLAESEPPPAMLEEPPAMGSSPRPTPGPTSGWTGRLIAGATGAGVVLVALALRDSTPLRRSPPPPPPRGWRKRAAGWLRGDDA